MADELTITPEEIGRIAELARLQLAPERIKSLHSDLNNILGYVRSLQALDLDDVEPTAHGSPVPTPLRDDVVLPSLSTEEALAAAPCRDGSGFVVPRVVN